MSAARQLPYQYVVLRCVPRVDREEFLNVGVVVYCQAADHLGVAWEVPRERLDSAFPDLDQNQLFEALEFVSGVCAGDERAGAVAGHTLSQRFGFLKAPRSTVIQPGPVHGGVTTDPAGEADRLLERLVR